MDKQNSSPKADNAQCMDSSKMFEKINKMEKELALMKEKMIDTNDATISGTGTMNAIVSSNGVVENSVELAKQLDAEFHENVFEHFPKLAFELKELCQKYSDLDLLKMVEENAKLNAENWAVFVIGKQLEKMSEQIAKIVEMMPKTEELEKKYEEHKYYDGEDAKLPELDKRLAELYAESIQICKYENCAGRIHAVRDRLILFKYRVDNVLALEFINQMITMTREIHDDAEKLADFVSSFAISRKTKTNAAYVQEHDQTFVNNMAKQLKKVYSRLFTLHQILKENFKLLDTNVNKDKQLYN